MIIAHLADQHLGFRQYQRLAPSGVNQREEDVSHAFKLAINGVLEYRPDLCILAGDLFHSVRPSNISIQVAYTQLKRLTDANIPTVLIGGNHDTPKSADVGCILPLFREIGIQVAVNRVEFFEFKELDCMVTAIPHPALANLRVDKMRPNEHCKYNVLTLHGEVEGAFKSMEYGGNVVRKQELNQGWDYVALGHYHIQTQIHPRVWYAGSHEYVSSDIWGEVTQEAAKLIHKGWLSVHLDTGYVEEHATPAVRKVIDLPILNAAGMNPLTLNYAICDTVNSIDLTDNVVRLRISNLSRVVERQLDYTMLRTYKNVALQFQLQIKRPEVEGAKEARVLKRQTIEGIATDYLAKRELPPGVNRKEFLKLGKEIMEGE